MKGHSASFLRSIVVLFAASGLDSPAHAGPPTLTTALDTYSLGVTITVVAAPNVDPLLGQLIQRSVDGGPWRFAESRLFAPTAVFHESPERGVDVAYRGLSVHYHEDPFYFTGYYFGLTPWSNVSSETIVPLQGVPIVRADDDVSPLGTFDNADLEDALADCYGLGGCNLVLEEATYEDVELKIGEFNDFNPPTETVYEELAAGFAMVGQGTGKSILKGKVYPVDDDWRATLLLDAVPFDGWIFQDFTLQGRKKDQPAPDSGIYVNNAGGLITAPPPGYNLPGYNTAPFIPNHNALPAHDKQNLLIHDLEILEYIANGISLIYVDDALIRDNFIEGAGCHHACESHLEPGVGYICDVPFVGLPDQDPETLCGSNDPADVAEWNVFNPTSIVPGTKVVGFGIGVFGGVDGGLIDGNTIRYATKHGITLYGPQGTGTCDTEGVTVSNNSVYFSASGFVNNGGCNSIFSSNRAQQIGLPGNDYTASLGTGFACGGRGDNNQWLDNYSLLNSSSGYSLGCVGPSDTFVANVTIDGNRSAANCLGAAQSSDTVMANGFNPSGFTISNHTIAGASECTAGLYLIWVDDVTVSSTTIDASRNFYVPPGTEAFDRVVWVDHTTNSTIDVDVQIGSLDITSGGYFDFHGQILSDVDVTVTEVSSAGGVILQDYTTVSGTATGQNVTYNGVLLP